MRQADSQSWVPLHPTLPVLREAVQKCQGCELYLHATQAVFGEGPRTSGILMIGEQPGNDEDLHGRPFVGPAGKLLDRALADASISRADVYLTNAVKHFKFEERGKRRIHKKPGAGEVRACRPWLEAEIALVKPRVVLCLGATASLTVFGPAFRLTKQRGVPIPNPWARHALATIHPSAILRAPDEDARHAEYTQFVLDLKAAAELL